MAERIAAFALVLQIWEALIHGKHMKEACGKKKPPCPTCGTGRLCYNYFCLECKTAGLCPALFSEGHEHHHHPWLQVRHYSGRHYSVLLSDLAQFMNEEALKHIYCTVEMKTGKEHCNLTSRKIAKTKIRATAAGKKRCAGCKVILPDQESQNPPSTKFLVCSLQCLVKVAQRKRSNRHLCAMQRGAMEQAMAPPSCNLHKLRLIKRSSLSLTLTSAQIRDEAPSSEPLIVANGGSHQPAEAASMAPAVEAPAVAGNSWRLEYPEPVFSEDFSEFVEPKPGLSRDFSDFVEPEPGLSGDFSEFVEPEPGFFVDFSEFFEPKLSELAFFGDFSEFLQPEPGLFGDFPEFLAPEPSFFGDFSEYLGPELDLIEEFESLEAVLSAF